MWEGDVKSGWNMVRTEKRKMESGGKISEKRSGEEMERRE